MKRKSRRFNRFLFPNVIVVSAVMPLLTAAPVNPDSFGNITVPTGTNNPDTLLASGGTNPAPVVLVQSGATITGDAGLMNGVVVSAPGYTINNFGVLGGDAEGVLVQAGASASVIINNNLGAIIQGGDDGIYLADDGGLITNFGIIRGITGANSDGIDAADNLTVTNNGTISGVSGIFADDLLNVTNNRGMTISGSTDSGINALDGASINNYGTISSSGSEGIIVNNDAVIFNSTSFDSFGNPVAGGRIEGATNGLFTGANLSLVNENLAIISGLNGLGIDAGDNSEVFNELGGVITGTLGGVSVGAGGYVENDGTISGNGGDGVTLGDNGEVFNTGLIQGTTGIVANNGSTITNSGRITSTAIGGNAFSGGAGNDNLFLSAGSLLTGNVLGGGGTNAITFDGGLTAPGSVVNSIRGSVTGFSTITKNGAGVALIGAVGDVGNGLTVSADTIAITGGGLYINADVSGATTALATINAGGAAVGGTGTWTANLNVTAGGISAGAIPINLDSNPENAVGALAITGNVVHSAGSFIRVDIVPGTPVIDGINSDLIEQIGVGNTYNVAGANLRLSSTNGNKVLSDGAYTIVDSDSAIIGAGSIGSIGIQFNPNTGSTGPFFPTESGTNATNTVLTNFFLTPGVTDGGTNLVATIQHDYAGLPGLTRNQASLGAALDASVDSGNSRIQSFISALDFSNLGAVQSTLAALSPDAFLSYSAGIVNSNYRLHRMLQDHLAAVRSSGDVMKMSMGSQADSKGAVVAPSVAPSNRGNFWGSLSYDWQDYSGNQSNTDFDGETGAITAGFDYRVAPALVLGIALDGSKSDFDGDGSSSDIDSFRVLIYGTWGESTGIYSDFVAGYGNHSMDLDRRLGGILGGSSSSSTDADSYQAMWTVGYAFGDSKVKHGPFAGLEYQTVQVDGFTQGGSLPVDVEDYDDDSFRALLGYRVNASLGRFTPYASIAYAHEFEDDGISTSASFGGSSFHLRGAERGSAVVITTGTGISLTNSLQLDIGYRGEISVEDEGLDSHGASIGLNYSF